MTRFLSFTRDGQPKVVEVVYATDNYVVVRLREVGVDGCADVVMATTPSALKLPVATIPALTSRESS